MDYTKYLSVTYACTKKEYLSGELTDSINRFLSMKPSRVYCFDLFLIFDQGDESEYSSLLDFESNKNINKVFIHSLNIPDKDNIYVRSRHSLKKFKEVGEPALGLSAGPNNLFFGAMNYLSKKEYDYHMVLETDTRPVKYFWFDLLFRYTENNDFLIGGSTYKGSVQIPEGAAWADHLNGVAIYNNSSNLHSLLAHAKQLILDRVQRQEDRCMVNYDIAIFYAAENLGLKSELLDTDIITNISLGADLRLKEQEILTKHRKTIVLHQKIYKPGKKFTLLTTLHYDHSEDRRKELAHCLEQNIKNKYIEDIIILTEVPDKKGFGKPIDALIIEHGLEVVRLKKRPTYFNFFDYANTFHYGKKIIVANSDIYFDESLDSALKNHNREDFYALTRWTTTDDGNSYLPHVFNSSFPIDKIDHKEMVGLRWWSPGMHPEGKWISKSKPVSPKYSKLTQEAWAQDGGTFDHFYDYEAKLESANSPGVNKSTKEAIMWRNEHSADAWIFEAPFGCNKNHKIPLGTFRCDTYLNYYLINSHLQGKIKLSNPCLSIKSFHYDYLRSEEDKNYVEDKIKKDGEDKFVDNYEFSAEYDKDISDDPDQVLHRCFVPWCSLPK